MRWRSEVVRLGWRRGQAGFTLLEILITLAILGMMLALLPHAVAGVATFRLRAAGSALADRLIDLHNAAMQRGRVMSIDIDPALRSYHVAGITAAVTLPAIVDRVMVNGDGPDTRLPQPRFSFFPDGSATAGTIILMHGDRRITIATEWFTGRVRTVE